MSKDSREGPLSSMCSHAQARGRQLLLASQKCDLSVREIATELTVLHIACMFPCEQSADIIRMLLTTKHGLGGGSCIGDVNAAGHDGLTPLMCAARGGCLDAAKVLLEFGAGAQINASETVHLKTALHMAAMHDSGELVTLLIMAGADKSAKDIKGLTPLAAALQVISRLPRAQSVIDAFN